MSQKAAQDVINAAREIWDNFTPGAGVMMVAPHYMRDLGQAFDSLDTGTVRDYARYCRECRGAGCWECLETGYEEDA